MNKLPLVLIAALAAFVATAQPATSAAAGDILATNYIQTTSTSQQIPDGFGGSFLLYEQDRIFRLQHIDAGGNKWPKSAVLTYAKTADAIPLAKACSDGRGGLWVMSYDGRETGAELNGVIQRFTFNGATYFPAEGKSLVIAGASVQSLEPDNEGGFWIKTPHRSRINANGELLSSASWRDVPESVKLLPATYATQPLGQESYVILHADRSRSVRTNLGIAATALRNGSVPGTQTPTVSPFQYRYTSDGLEVSMLLQPDEIQEVEINMHNAAGEQVYGTAGFVSEANPSWHISTQHLSAGSYYLTMRLGAREQQEEVVVSAQ